MFFFYFSYNNTYAENKKVIIYKYIYLSNYNSHHLPRLVGKLPPLSRINISPPTQLICY